MKMLLLNYEYPPLGGGAGEISRYIAEGLARLDHTVTVVTAWYPGEPETITGENGRLKIVRLKSKRKHKFKSDVFEMISWMRHTKAFLEEHLTENNYDIVFANFALPGGAVARDVFKKFQLPYVVMSHGHDIPWFFPRQMWFYHACTYFRIRSVCKSASALFVQSEDMLHNAVRFLGSASASKVRLLHNGADFKLFYPDQIARSERFRILFAGRLVPQKGPMIFLNAIKKLQVLNIPFEVIVIGDGPMRRKMQRFVSSHQLQHFVRFIGWLDKKEMPMAYRTAHCMVAPSLNEGMSMALNEALASGLYAFTTPVSCNVSLIHSGVNGEIIPQNDPVFIAERLKEFYQNKFLNDYRVPEEEVRQFHEEYSWDHIVKQYEEALIPLINS